MNNGCLITHYNGFNFIYHGTLATLTCLFNYLPYVKILFWQIIYIYYQIIIFPSQSGQSELNLPINMVFDAILTNDIYFNVPSYLFFPITIMAIKVGLAQKLLYYGIGWRLDFLTILHERLNLLLFSYIGTWLNWINNTLLCVGRDKIFIPPTLVVSINCNPKIIQGPTSH